MSYVRLEDLADVDRAAGCRGGLDGGVCNDVNPGFTKMLPRHLKNLLGIGKPRCIACGAQDTPLAAGSGHVVGLFCPRCANGGWIPSAPRTA